MEQGKLRYGMVGGGPGAFIGGVHRRAIAFDGGAELVAGCFSTNAARSAEAGAALGLEPGRVYAGFDEMAQKEAARADGIDFAVIVTPNDSHYQVAKAFLQHGIHVFCEKPLCHTVRQAAELKTLAAQKGLLFGVAYAYSGNVMVKQARQLVAAGEIGDIVNVNAEYLQEWLIDDIGAPGGAEMNKLSAWRKNPERAGISNCVGDIGTHVEHTVAYITGRHVTRLAAVLDRYGQPLDLNANILIELDGGAHGVYASSQVCVGHMNGLVVRVYGTKGAIEWVQENPNVLYVTKKGEPMQIYNRGMAYVADYPARVSRLPSGHPEGLFVAFANLYRAYIGAVQKKKAGQTPDEADLDFPTVDDGLAGVAFVHAAVESAEKGAAWVEVAQG